MDRPRTIRRLRMGRGFHREHFQVVRISWHDEWDLAVTMRYSRYLGYMCAVEHERKFLESIKEEALSEGYYQGRIDGSLYGHNDHTYPN